MVSLDGPNSTTSAPVGATNLPSEVPPAVESEGLVPTICSTLFETMPIKSELSVRKVSQKPTSSESYGDFNFRTSLILA